VLLADYLALAALIVNVVTLLIVFRQLRVAEGQSNQAIAAAKETQQMAKSASMLQVSSTLLQLKLDVLSHPDTASLLTGSTAINPDVKRKAYMAMLFTVYADIYDLKVADLMPNDLYEQYRDDLRQIMQKPEFKARWKEVREGFNNREFRLMIEQLGHPF
jgi:hypothetical protein